MLLVTSCATPPVALPVSLALDFPLFPEPPDDLARLPDGTVATAPTGEAVMLPDETVVMPLAYLTAIAEYVLGVQRVQEILRAVRGPVIIEGGN